MAAAVTDQRDQISARRCVAGFQATEAGAAVCWVTGATTRPPMSAVTATAIRVCLMIFLSTVSPLGAKARIAASEPGLVIKVLQIGMVPLMRIKPL